MSVNQLAMDSLYGSFLEIVYPISGIHITLVMTFPSLWEVGGGEAVNTQIVIVDFVYELSSQYHTYLISPTKCLENMLIGYCAKVKI